MAIRRRISSVRTRTGRSGIAPIERTVTPSRYRRRRRYTVRRGESFSDVARKYDTTPTELTRANPDVNVLSGGQVINVPEPSIQLGIPRSPYREPEPYTPTETPDYVVQPGGWVPPSRRVKPEPDYGTGGPLEPEPYPEPAPPTYTGPYPPEYAKYRPDLPPYPSYGYPWGDETLPPIPGQEPVSPYQPAIPPSPYRPPEPYTPTPVPTPEAPDNWYGGGVGYRDEFGRFFPGHIPGWQMASHGLTRGEPPQIIKASWVDDLTSGETFWSRWTTEDLEEMGYILLPNGDWFLPPPGEGGGGGDGGGYYGGGGGRGRGGGGGGEEEAPAPTLKGFSPRAAYQTGRMKYPGYSGTGRYMDDISLGLINWRI